LSSHLVAFTAFKMLAAQYTNLNIYGLLRLPASDFIFPKNEILKAIEQLQKVLLKWESQNKLKLSEQIYLPPNELLAHGIAEVGIYHLTKPLGFNRNGDVVSRNLSLLFFYHNRLENYGLEKTIDWSSFEIKLDLSESDI
jgi:glycerol-3-phosphate O-acyltransferase